LSLPQHSGRFWGPHGILLNVCLGSVPYVKWPAHVSACPHI